MSDSTFAIPVKNTPSTRPPRPHEEGYTDGYYYARANSGPFGPFWRGPFRQLVDAETAAKAELVRFHPAALAECVFTSADVGKRYWNKAANRWRLFVESSFTEVYTVDDVDDTDARAIPPERVFFGKVWSGADYPVYMDNGTVSLGQNVVWRAAKDGYGRFSKYPTVILQNPNTGAASSYADKTFVPGQNPSPFFDIYINRPNTDLPNDNGGEGQFLSHAELRIISVDRWVEVFPIAYRTDNLPIGLGPFTYSTSDKFGNDADTIPFIANAFRLTEGGFPVYADVQLLDGARIVHADFKRTFPKDNVIVFDFEKFQSVDAYPSNKANGIEVDGTPEGIETLDKAIQDIAFPDYPAQRFNFAEVVRANGQTYTTPPAQQNVITCNIEVTAVYVVREGGAEYFAPSTPYACSVSVMPTVFGASSKQMPAVQLPIPPQPANYPLHGDYIRRSNEGEQDARFYYRSVVDGAALGPDYTYSGAYLKVTLDTLFRRLSSTYESKVFYGGRAYYKDFINDPRKDHTFGYDPPKAQDVKYDGYVDYSYAEDSFVRAEQSPGVDFPFKILPYAYPVVLTQAFDPFPEADGSAYPAHELGGSWTRWHGSVTRIVEAFENDSSLDYPYLSTDGAVWDTVIYGNASASPELDHLGDPPPAPAPAPAALYKGGIQVWIPAPDEVSRIKFDNDSVQQGTGSKQWREIADDGTVFYIGYGAQEKTPNGTVIVGYEQYVATPGTGEGNSDLVTEKSGAIYANGPFRFCLNCDEDSTTIPEIDGTFGDTSAIGKKPNPDNVLTVGATDGPEVQKFATIRRQTANGEIALTLYRVPQKKGILI